MGDGLWASTTDHVPLLEFAGGIQQVSSTGKEVYGIVDTLPGDDVEGDRSSSHGWLHQVVTQAECKEKGCKVCAGRLCHATPTCAHSESTYGVSDMLVWTMESNEEDKKILRADTYRLCKDYSADSDKCDICTCTNAPTRLR